MSTLTNFEVYASRLRDSSIVVKLKYTIALELCESLEFFQPHDTPAFMNILWPAIREYLLNNPPVFISASPEHKLRSTLIDTVRRVPLSESLRDYAPDLANTFLELAKIEDEENAVVCLKIIYDLHRMYYTKLDNFAKPFFEMAFELYGNAGRIAEAAREASEVPSSGAPPASTPGAASIMSPGPTSPGQEGSGEAPKKILLPASQSFKVIAEIPIIIVSMFQALRGETHQYAQKLVPLVIQMLEINLSQPREGSDAANQGSSLAALMDLATAQSKALSFLAFLVRSFFQTVAPYRDKVAELVVKMIQMCPVEAIATRKEILIACRHIISTDMRLAFVPHLEQLLDLRILREPANSNHKMVKVYAISTLVDLVHSIRNELSLDHLTKVVDFYTSCMSDISLTPTIHTMCVKILFYIVESVAKFPDKKRVKYLLLSILHCYKCALSMLATRAKYTMTLAMGNDQDDSSSSSESNGSSGERRAVLWRVEPDDLIHVSTLEPQDPVKECKTLLQTLITGCNPTLDKLKSCHSFLFEGPSAAEQHQQQSEKPSTDVADMGTSDMYNFELDQLKSLFHEGLRAFQIMKCAGQLGSTSSHAAATEKPRDDVKKDRSQTAPSRELQIRAIDRDEKALIEQFANLFLGLHPTVFQELISSQIGYLFDVMIDNAAMISASQLFLACVSTSPAFISTLLEYLGQRLPYLGTNDEVLSATMLHLYKIAFLALTFFPEQNEPVLRIYVQSIIRDALERSKTAQKPENYYLLLRSLFRCIGGGRYETLYSEVFPLLQTLLETFNTSLSVEGKPTPRQELVIDICLTVPVRLSALLPYLPLLMKPLMAALHAGPELVSQGLRTLELCVDNLTRDFLDPILNSFMDNLMESLWGLLTPNEQRSPHSRTAARILGKLGGRNRNMLGVQPTQLANNSVPVLQLPDNSATAIRLKFHNINEYVTLPISPGIETAVQTIESHYPPWLARHAYSNAFRFIKTTLLVLIEQQDASAPLSLLSRRSAADLEALGSKFMELFDNIETRKMLATLISLSTSGSPAELTIKEITEKPLASTSSASGDKDGSAEIDSAANGFSTDPQQAISLTGASPQVTFQLLWGAVVACSRDCIRDEATHLLDQLAHYIVAEHFVACIRAAKTNTLQDMAIPTLTFEGDASHMSGGNFTISVASGANCSLNLMAILVIARAISSHLQNVRMVGQRFLSTLVAATRGLLKGSQNYIYCVPHLHLLFSQLCQSCYYPDENVKMGACSGILFMITKLNLGKDWIEMHEIEGIKALLFVLKALSVEKVAQMCENVALEAVISIIGVCHSSVNPEVFVTVTEGDDKAMEIETGGDNKLEKKQAEGSTDSPSVGPSGEAKVNGSSNSDKGMPLAEKDVTGSPAKANEDGKKGPDAEKLGTQHVNGDMPDPGERRVEGGNERAEGEPQKVSKRPKIDISKDRTLSILLSIFAKELPNSNSLIREAVKTAIEHLAKLTGISTIDLLMPYRDRLLRSIFAKPLRALPHLMQIGRIDAITYCLDLSPDFIEINDEMMRLLSEALALTDAEDQALVNNPTQLRTYIPSLINLRHVCIKMLTSAISRPEFSQPRHSITRSRIISVFFKFLYSKSPKVVEVANDGLKRALTQQQRLPKDLLQAGLRPILLNLSDYKHLNVTSLDGLARLMKLLTNYFKDEVGKKLLDHLHQWANTDKLRQASTKTIKDLHEVKILVAILNIFHLLPASAVVLLDDLVTMVVTMETHLMRRESSPFRKPLFLFLNHYPAEAIKYFFDRIDLPHYARMFAEALAHESCRSLRKELTEDPSRLVVVLTSASPAAAAAAAAASVEVAPAKEAGRQPQTKADMDANADKMEVEDAKKEATEGGNDNAAQADGAGVARRPTLRQMHGCLLVEALISHIPSLLDSHPLLDAALMKTLWETWCAEALPSDTKDRLTQATIVNSIVSIAAASRPGSAAWMQRVFRIVATLDMNTGILDSGKIECFLWSRVLGLATLPSIRETVEVFFGSLYRSQVSMDTKACILRRVVIPLISEGICPGKSFGVAAASQAPCKAVPSCRSSEIDARAEKLLKGPILEYMHSNIWVAFSTSESYKPGHDDYLRLQFISLSFILLRKAPHLVGDMRKDMIRFGWTCVRHDNPVVKNAAYVLLAQFIAAFETPRKIVIQVLLHLLRAHQPEYRPMVRQALEILVPSLTIRLATGAPSAELPIWVKWFNRVLFEHGHTVGQIVHIHQLITHLSDVFYPYREQLAPKLVNSLTKLCLTQNATLETRTLALDIIEMLLDWDIQHIKTVVSHSERFESTPLSQLRQEMANTIITKQRRETVVGILLRILCLAYDFVAKSGLAKRLKELLNKYLDKDSWPPMHLRLTFFERALSMPDTKPERMPFFEHILQTLDLVSMNMQQSWVVENFAILANTSIKFLKTESPVVHELIARQLSRLYQAMGASETLYDSHTTTNFRQQVQTHILENLQSGSNLHGVLRILDAIGKYQGEQFYDYIPLLVKLLQKHAREYVAQSSSQSAASGGTAAVPSGGQPHSLATTVNQGSAELDEATILRMVRTVPSTSEIKGSTQRDILLLLMVILHNHLMQLGDQRRGYLATLIQLVERVNDPHVLVTILSMVYNWVLRSPDPFPTIKEKATIMAAMICFATDPQANPKWSPITSTVQAPSPADGNGGATRSGQAFTAYQIMSKEYLSLVAEIYGQQRFSRSELTMRLEHAFLLGLKCWDHALRNRFLAIFDSNLPRSLVFRLNYFFKTQNWESLNDSFWLQSCIPLLLGSVHIDASIYASNHAEGSSSSNGEVKAKREKEEGKLSGDDDGMEIEGPQSMLILAQVSESLRILRNGIGSLQTVSLIQPLTQLLAIDVPLTYNLWVQWFPRWWRCLAPDDQHDVSTNIIYLLASPHLKAQASSRPNVVQTFLEALTRCENRPRLPPQLLRYLGQTYEAWLPAIALLEENVLNGVEVEASIFDHAMGVETGAFNALGELYLALGEHQYYLGLWKRHCQYNESHVALSYEQLGDWQSAQNMYEKAQSKARTGALPFSESEYSLWENRWIESTKRLQSWDMLCDLGKQEALPELELEAGWRLWDWSAEKSTISSLLAACQSDFSMGTRSKFYEAYLRLVNGVDDKAKLAEFQSLSDSGMQTALHQWHSLPPVGTQAHLELLHQFQLFTELQDAQSIYSSLATTRLDNLESRSDDLKSVMQTWRERLPSNNDPISIWSDLVAWRQHIFRAINEVYIPFIPKFAQAARRTNDQEPNGNSAQQGSAPNSVNSPAANTTFAYRGYHETAWIINRFAHVARKHGLMDVCISSLTKIYTLPNIEIQEAFLKLREQAKCYYNNPKELHNGLDVINNTNLAYFSISQKAEFFTLKGRFLTKLGMLNEANNAFANGIQVDLRSAKAWASWARYNDERFRNAPNDISWAVNAISCYLQASCISKNAKARRFHTRILWLLSQDDASKSAAKAFEEFKGEVPTWYWVSFVPQLLLALNEGYSKQALQILLRIAKACPQALQYALRTVRDEVLVLQRQQQLQQQQQQQARPSTPPSQTDPGASTPRQQQQQQQSVHLHPTKVDELMSKLKTAHPLLSLSIESMTDQIVQRIKPTPIEEMYRLVCVLANDVLQNLYARVSTNNKDLKLLDTMAHNIRRVISSLQEGPIKQGFERDFSGVDNMDMVTYTSLLLKWRTKLFRLAKSRPAQVSLSRYSMFLMEFEYEKFENIDVPGQYAVLRDYNDDLVRIERFLPEVSLVCNEGSTISRCLSILGRNGRVYHFVVQNPSSRHSRREERAIQYFRTLNYESSRERSTINQRLMEFYFPVIVPLSHHIRLIQHDLALFTLQNVFSESPSGQEFDALSPRSIIMQYIEGMPKLVEELSNLEDAQIALFDRVCSSHVPRTLLRDYILQFTPSQLEFWLYRRKFTYQAAMVAFLSYIVSVSQRTPSKLALSRRSANLWSSDMLPAYSSNGLITNPEAVPFRLTPNMQHLATDLGLEGIFPFALHDAAAKLLKPELFLRDFTEPFIKDELLGIYTISHAPSLALGATYSPPRDIIENNVKQVLQRVAQLSTTLTIDEVSKTNCVPLQPAVDLIMEAVAPERLAKMDFTWMPWL